MKYVLAAFASGILFFFIGLSVSPDDRSREEALEAELASVQRELDELIGSQSREEECESNLITLSESYGTEDLESINSLRRGCSAERLSSFDAEFVEVSARMDNLQTQADEHAAAERAAREERQRQRDQEKELRDRRREAEWSERIDRNRITDTEDVYLGLDSEPYFRKYDRGSARLTIRCRENTTALTMNFGEYVGDDSSSPYADYKNVTLRIDDQEPIVRRMDTATNNEAVGFWNGGQSIPFIKQMLGADELVVRITPYGENTREVVFPIAGLEFFIDPVRENCGW